MYSTEIEVESCIRGHHMYSTVWTLCQGNCYLAEENWIMPKIDMLSQYVESMVSLLVTFQGKYHFFVQCLLEGAAQSNVQLMEIINIHMTCPKGVWKYPVGWCIVPGKKRA